MEDAPGRANQRRSMLAATVLTIGLVSSPSVSDGGVWPLPVSSQVAQGDHITIKNDNGFSVEVTITNETSGEQVYESTVPAHGSASWQVAGNVGDVLLTEVWTTVPLESKKHTIVAGSPDEE